VGGGKKTEKRKGVVKILDTQGFGAFRFYSVFIPFSIPFYPSRESLWVVCGKWFSFGRVCFPFSLPLSQLFLLGGTTNGKNGKNGKRCLKWLILKGLVFSVFYSVFCSVYGDCLIG
jgi:hypothetical protein